MGKNARFRGRLFKMRQISRKIHRRTTKRALTHSFKIIQNDLHYCTTIIPLPHELSSH